MRVSTMSHTHADFTNNGVEERMVGLEERLKRTRGLLEDLQRVSKLCEEDEQDAQERNVFRRRVVQITSELDDARDLLHACIRPWLSSRQFALIASESDTSDPTVDPSVRFFGLDWQELFSRAVTLSLNAQLLSTQLVCMDKEVSERRGRVNEGVEEENELIGLLDLMLVHNVLRDLGRIQLDVGSHAEAVLHNRLSKSQQRLMQREQLRLSHLIPGGAGGAGGAVTRSRSLRDARVSDNAASSAARVKKSSAGSCNAQPYRKTRTTHLTVEDDQGWHEQEREKKESASKTSVIHNVTAFFKNMR